MTRRVGFQISLSTATLLMFVAGGLLWANFKIRRISDYSGFAFSTFEQPIGFERGWPFRCYLSFPSLNRPEIGRYQIKDRWILQGLVLNFLASIVILVFSAFVSELLMRSFGRKIK